MQTRLHQIISYKTNGKKKQFADLLGWTPQYLQKLLGGGNFGLQPVITLLSKFPDINARWLLLGEGTMLSSEAYTIIRNDLYSHIHDLLNLERLLPYMQPDDLLKFEQSVIKGTMPVFSPEKLSEWQSRADEYEHEIDLKFKSAIGKSDELCRQKKVK